jgi:hypothetical protein
MNNLYKLTEYDRKILQKFKEMTGMNNKQMASLIGADPILLGALLRGIKQTCKEEVWEKFKEFADMKGLLDYYYDKTIDNEIQILIEQLKDVDKEQVKEYLKNLIKKRS